jgi:hypothetical protein
MIPRAPIPYLYDRLFGPLSTHQYSQQVVELALAPSPGRLAWPLDGQRLAATRRTPPVDPIAMLAEPADSTKKPSLPGDSPLKSDEERAFGRKMNVLA